MCHVQLFAARIVATASLSVLWPEYSKAQVVEPARSITSRDVARHVEVIAHDSMLGRDTPSPGLEMTARYVANQFRMSGLKPWGDSGTYFQRYTTPLQIDFSRSRVAFSIGKRQAVSTFMRSARLARGVIPKLPKKADVLLVAGRHTAESLQRIAMQDKIILIAAAGVGSAVRQDVIERLVTMDRDSSLASGPEGVIVLSDEDTTIFRRRLQAGLQSSIYRPNQSLGSLYSSGKSIPPRWAVHVQPESIEGLNEVLAAAGHDLAEVLSDTIPVLYELSSLRISLEMELKGMTSDTATAPNVVAVLEGSDPKLKLEYVVFSAHMDHVGVTHDRTDSINNGTNDNASGTAGLIELARAFSQSGERPRRSLLFLATSGGSKSFWGSTSFVEKRVRGPAYDFSRIPQLSVVANINVDMIGSPIDDSLRIDGMRAFGSEVRPEWVVAAHPELRLTATDEGSVFSRESDHFAFVANELLIPSMTFRAGSHKDDHAEAESSTLIDAEKVVRVLRLVFYVGQGIANADRRPWWTSEGRRQLREFSENPR